jgi:hypothetical protein
MGSRVKTPEGQLLRAVLDLLAAKHVLAFRIGVGAMKVEDRFMRWGTPGMSDILAFPPFVHANTWLTGQLTVPTWIECKAPKGVQSALQKSFQKQVEEHGHRYAIIRDLSELEDLLR